MLYRYLLVLVILSLAGCSSVEVQSNSGRGLQLLPRDFFDGKICADGVVRDYSGEQIRNFNAEIIASWNQNGIGKLDEVFQFNDGVEYRVWQLVPEFDEQQQVVAYQASASDVPEATRLEFSGNAIYMDYDINYQTGTDEQGNPQTLSLSMVDRMYLVSPGVVINETNMYKFGIRVGQVLLVMRQVDNNVACLM